MKFDLKLPVATGAIPIKMNSTRDVFRVLESISFNLSTIGPTMTEVRPYFGSEAWPAQ